jgi:hypothetical protein
LQLGESNAFVIAGVGRLRCSNLPWIRLQRRMHGNVLGSIACRTDEKLSPGCGGVSLSASVTANPAKWNVAPAV